MLTQKFILTKKGENTTLLDAWFEKKIDYIIIYLKDFKKVEIV